MPKSASQDEKGVYNDFVSQGNDKTIVNTQSIFDSSDDFEIAVED
jgi:hypothetical protein